MPLFSEVVDLNAPVDTGPEAWAVRVAGVLTVIAMSDPDDTDLTLERVVESARTLLGWCPTETLQDMALVAEYILASKE